MAPLICVVPGCNAQQSEIWHRFPKDLARCQAWMQFCDLVIPPKPCDVICERHFDENDYQPSYRILGRSRKLWRLKVDAVPTLVGPEQEVEEFTFKEPDEVEIEMISLDEVINRCRLCSNIPEPGEEHAESLFDGPDGGLSIADHLLEWFQLKFSDSPEWPSVVCGCCAIFIGQIREFQNMIVASHNKFFDDVVMTELIVEDSTVEAIDESFDCMEEKYHQQMLEDEEEDEEYVVVEEEVVAPLDQPPKKPPPTEERASELEKLMLDMDLLHCSACSLHHTSLEELYDHMREAHAVRFGHIYCCGEKRTHKAKILEHLECHLTEGTLKCLPCNAEFTDKAALKEHSLVVHINSPLPFKCTTCEKSFPVKARLVKHSMIHLPKHERPVKCEHCESRFVNRNQLRRHVERIHDVRERHVCDQCGKGFSSYSSLWDHMNAQHKNRGWSANKKPTRDVANCPICHKKVVNMAGHMVKIHGATEDMCEPLFDPTEEVSCPVCQEVMLRSQMRQHSIRHVNSRAGGFCDICLVRIKGGGHFRDHMDKHKQVMYPCEYCDKTYNNYQGWYLHMKSKHKEIYEETIAKNK